MEHDLDLFIKWTQTFEAFERSATTTMFVNKMDNSEIRRDGYSGHHMFMVQIENTEADFASMLEAQMHLWMNHSQFNLI